MLVNKSRARVKYEQRTKTLIRSLKARQISRRECLGELDAAFERFLAPNTACHGLPFVVDPTMGCREWSAASQTVARLVEAQNELFDVRALVIANNSAVMEELAMRPIHLVPKKTLAARQV